MSSPNTPGLRELQGGKFLDAGVGKTEPVDQALLGRQAKDARAWIARLRTRREGAEFHEAEAEPRPGGDALGIFVETGGEADRVREGEAEEFFLERGEIEMRERLKQMAGE